MKRLTMATSACILAIGLAAICLAKTEDSANAPLTGTWQCLSHGGENGDLPFTLYLEQNGETITGSVSSSIGGADITAATFKDGVLEIHIDTDESSYLLTAKLGQETLKGEWTHDDQKGTWEGKKSPPPEAQH